jgi:hypothetical protein
VNFAIGSQAKQDLEWQLMRLQFSIKINMVHKDFDFAKYLSMSMGEILAEMVELPLWTWLGLELIALCFYGIQTVCPPVVLMWVWIALVPS